MIMMQFLAPNLFSQSSDNNLMNLDEDYLQIHPESVEDVLNEMKNKQKDDARTCYISHHQKILKNQFARMGKTLRIKRI